MLTAHPLIETLHVAVHRDRRPSGLSGAVAVGVLGRTGTAWLEVSLDGVAQAKRVDDPSDGAAWLLLGEREASALILDGTLPHDAELVKVVGDSVLLQRFTHRYLRRRDALSVRGSAP